MNKKMNRKKQNRMAVRQAAAKAVLRDEQNRRIQFAATNPEGEVLKNLRTTPVSYTHLTLPTNSRV